MPRRLLPAALLVLSACGGAVSPPMTSVSTGWSEQGVASWYGPGFHGKRTASGEVYDMDDMTAAHKRLPFGTRVRVHNRDNGRETVVRINDRGPFVDGRIIDLSRAAAREIGMLGTGTARVRIAVVEVSRIQSCSLVQVGAFADIDNAGDLEGRLRAAGQPVEVARGSDGLTRVFAGPYDDLERAQSVRDRYDGILVPCTP